jgi:hypothetical protein
MSACVLDQKVSEKGLNLNGSLIISLTFFKLAVVGAEDELSCKRS